MLNDNRPSAATDQPTTRTTREGLPKPQRARRTNDVFDGLNMNVARDRRVADLLSAYLEALGNPSSHIRRTACWNTAELQVIAEETRAEALKSGSYDLENIVRVQNVADRALDKLEIKPSGKSHKSLTRALAEAAS